LKIAGKTLATRNTKCVHLVRGEERYPILVCALPPGWEGKMRAIGLFNNPPKPKIAAKEKIPGSGLFVKDSAGNVIYEEDRQDPVYRDAITKFSNRIQAIRLAEHLSMDPTVQFDSVKPQSTELAEWLAYGDALAQELESPEGGFTDGEIEEILNVGDKLGSSIDLTAGVGHFLPPA
jgi:hypothetical protein